MDVVELLRVLREGAGDRRSTKLLNDHRRTIARYRQWAQQHGLLDGPLPSPAALPHLLDTTLPRPLPPQQTSSLAADAREIADGRARGMEIAAIRVRLEERPAHAVSDSAVRRLVQRLEPPAMASAAAVFVRVEGPPGSEGQVDFGYAGRTVDPATGAPRKTWGFVLVRSWSRHLYAELVFDQKRETWLLCHRHAFEAWGGVPARVVPDPRKLPMHCMGPRHPPGQLPRPGRATGLPGRRGARRVPHRPQSPAPAPAQGPSRTGRRALRQAPLPGRMHAPAADGRAESSAPGMDHSDGGATPPRHHPRAAPGAVPDGGASRPAVIAGHSLRPGPLEAGGVAPRLPRDCSVCFEQAYYSAPFRLVGQLLWVRGGARTVERYTADHQLVATPTRAQRPGEVRRRSQPTWTTCHRRRCRGSR